MSQKMSVSVNLLLLAVSVLVVRHSQAAFGIMTDIYLCEDKTAMLTVSAQNSVKLCCSVLPSYCPSYADSSSETSDVPLSSMSLLPRGVNVSDQLYHDLGLVERQVDNCTTELTIKYPPPGKVTFDCFWDGYSNNHHDDVYFVEEPVKPNITGVLTTAKKVITVNFERGDPTSETLYDNYTVTLVGPDGTCGEESSDIMCHWNPAYDLGTPLCDDNSRLCTCKKDMAANVCNASYTITINVSRPFASVTTQKVVNLVQYVRPQAMTDQSEKVISPYEAEVLFCLKGETLKLASYINTFMDPLFAKVVLDKRQGILQTSTLNIDINKSWSKCIVVSLTGLTPFTNYTFTTSAVAGGGEGNPTVTYFTTHKTAPLAPPVVDDSMYSWTNMTLNDGSSQGVLVLYWQELPQASRGGADISYDLELWSADDLCVLNQSEISTTYKVVYDKLPPSSLTVKLWARNEIGRSENFSTITVPSRMDTVPIVYHVELSEHVAHIHIQKSTLQTTNQKLLVLICKEYDRVGDLNLCKSDPVTRTLDLTQATESSTSSSLTLTVQLASYHYYTTTSRQEDITYYLLRNKNDDNRDYRTGAAVTDIQNVVLSDIPPPSDGSDDMDGGGSGNGVVTVDVEDEEGEDGEQNVADMDYTSEEFGISKREAVPHAYSRKPRDIAEIPLRYFVKPRSVDRNHAARGGNQRLLSTDDGMYRVKVNKRHLLSTDVDTDLDFTVPPGLTSTVELPVLDDSLSSSDSADSSYRLFVSQNAEDGSLMGQNTPQCYYTEQSDEVDLKVVSEKREGSVPWLRLFQDCDKQPRQFLVDLYQVFVSQDDLCQNIELVGEVRNSLFEPTEIQLPEGSKVACVRALRLASESATAYSSDFTAQPINLENIDTGESTDISTVLAITVPLVVILVVGILAFGGWKCRQKSQKTKANSERIQQLMEEGVEEERIQYPPNISGGERELPALPKIPLPSSESIAGSGKDPLSTDSGNSTAPSMEGPISQRGSSHTSIDSIAEDGSGPVCQDVESVGSDDSGSDSENDKETEQDTRQESDSGQEPTQNNMLPQGFVSNVKHCVGGEKEWFDNSGGISNSGGSLVSWGGWGSSGDTDWGVSGGDNSNEASAVGAVSREGSSVCCAKTNREQISKGNEENDEVSMRERTVTTADGSISDRDSTEVQDNKVSSESLNAPAYSHVAKIPDAHSDQTNVPDQQMWSISPNNNVDNTAMTTLSDHSPPSNMENNTATTRTRNDSGLGPVMEDEWRSSVNGVSISGGVVDCLSDCESGVVWSRTNSYPGSSEGEGEGCSSPGSDQCLLFDPQSPFSAHKGFDFIRYKDSFRAGSGFEQLCVQEGICQTTDVVNSKLCHTVDDRAISKDSCV